MSTVRLTMAQALVRFLAAQKTRVDAETVPLFAGMWAIFGHGNVAGMGEALWAARDRLPTYRAHNEQGMAHAAIAFSKASFRRRMMACTTSIGPGATNMVTAAAVAHVNRLPVLFLPGDIFANRLPDPVLQQIEDFSDGTISANDCFRPVSRYFDRIIRPEQILAALPRAMSVLTDPAECGPVTLGLCQDVQAEAYDYPESFFEEQVWVPRRLRPDVRELNAALRGLEEAQKPLIIAGGGALYSGAADLIAALADRYGIPVCETQAGKSTLPHDHPLNLGSIGVTGTPAANKMAQDADLILAVGTRLQDFTTGSWTLFKGENRRIIALNTQPYDAGKHHALPLVADAREGLAELGAGLQMSGYQAPGAWSKAARDAKAAWLEQLGIALAPTNAPLPSDAEVIGAVARTGGEERIVVCAAGGLPGELHKLWQPQKPGGYHLEYGFSCMGYEIAGGLGVKLARSDHDVVVMVGDGSYMMMNSELATAVMMGLKLTIVVLDNRGYGCINRLQRATGGAPFNNLLKDSRHAVLPSIDFRAHAESMGASAVKVASIAELEQALLSAKAAEGVQVVVVDTSPDKTTEAGGHWWDVAVPEVSDRAEVRRARAAYEENLKLRQRGD